MENGVITSLCHALDYIADEANGHVIFQDKSDADAIALWVASSYLLDHWLLFPKLLINSPERECGKSTALQLVEAFVRNGYLASSITPSALYRTIQHCKPTLLIDEADRSIKGSEELNGLINAAQTRRGARKLLSVKGADGDWKPTEFSLWCPQAIAGIGEFEDTLMSRSIVIGLRRKLTSEQVRRMHIRYFEDQEFIRKFLIDWSESATPSTAVLELPTEAGNRMQDNWEPLFRVAAMAGDTWVTRALRAFDVIEVQRKSDKVASSGSELLAEIREILKAEVAPEVASNVLLDKLLYHHDGEWMTANNGRSITGKWLAKTLKLYGVRPQRRAACNVYLLADLEEAFRRYLPPL
jgi:putative DNA primase/helicase